MTALAPRPRPGVSSVDALVDAAIDGDERAWESICAQHLPEVRAVASARLRDAHAAEDVVQETFVTAWTRLHQVRDAHRLGPWLKTIAANLATDHVRRQRDMAPLDAAVRTPAPGPSHDDVLVAREEAEVLHSHLERLRDVDRTALWQRDGHGVPVGELADQLGMTAGSVRVLLTRARQRVRDGYGVVPAPVAALDWMRHRLAGLGDAVPVAVAAPVVVVAVVAGVAGTALDRTPPPAPSTQTVALAPAPTETLAAVQLPSPRPSPAPSPTEVTAPAATTAPTVTTAAAPASAPEPAEVTVGSESAGFAAAPPTEDDREADADADTPAGPVEGLEVYLEETGISELDEECLTCG